MDEISRVHALHEKAVLDTAAEARFDRLAAMAAQHFDAPIALVSLVDSDRQWFKACVGLQERETPRDWAFCHHAIQLGKHKVMVVEDATKDARFVDNPLVTGKPHIRFYAGATLTTEDGTNLGTLCVIDTKSRSKPSDADLAHLRALADLVVDQIELSYARKQLEDRHQILDLAEQLSLTGYWTLNTETKAVFWSPQVYAIHGVDDTIFTPGLDDALGFYIPEDRVMIEALMAKQSATGGGWNFNATIVRRDGSRRSVRSVAECLKDGSGKVTGFIGVFRDLTDERRVIAEAVEQERRYRLLADHASDVIAVYDASGRFRYLSPSIIELLGLAPEELIGRTPFDIMVKGDHARVAAEFAAAAMSGSALTVEYRALAKDGSTRWLEARPRFHRDEDGQIIEIIDSVRDVTERREREVVLAEARAEAESATKVKAAFLANMSHEIRTPMNGVIGFTELLAGTSLDEDQQRFVEMIAYSGRLISQLLNDILDVSKIEAGQMQLAVEPMDIRHKMRGVVRLMEPAAAAKGIALSLMIDDAVPSTIIGDHLRLRQILINLTANAVKFTPHGRVTIHMARVPSDAGPLLRVAVHDTGIGIAPERIDSVFETFSQADSSIARKFGGSGLGLSISKQLVELMGGTLSAVSELGAGATFTIDLPLLLPSGSSGQATRSARPAESVTQQGARRARILVAEDHDINQMLILELGKQLGLNFEIAANGERALAMVHEAFQSGYPYNLVLMDMQMPVLDGLQTTRRLRADGFSPDSLPIVALTANAFAENVAACLEAGMQDHLSKPVSKQDLQQVIEGYIDRRASIAPANPLVEAPAHDRSSADSLDNKYIERKRQTLEFFARLAQSERCGDGDHEKLIDMLHKLAGTAGMFGEPSLGDTALQVERAVSTAPSDSRQDAIRAGWEQLNRGTWFTFPEIVGEDTLPGHTARQ